MKKPKKVTLPATQPWSPQEVKVLKKRFPNTATEELAFEFGRSMRSLHAKASALGLTKTPEHRSAMSSKVALSHLPDKNELKRIGRLGGLKGGPARSESLSASQRKSIARKAIKARWSKNKAV